MTNCQILTEDVISLPPLGTPKMSLITLEPERENEGGRGDVVGPAPQASNQNTFKPATHAIATMDHSSAHQTATAVIEEVKILPNKSQVCLKAFFDVFPQKTCNQTYLIGLVNSI